MKSARLAWRRASRRKIVVYIATRADGYIARPDVGVEWLNRPRTDGDYGMGAFVKSIDTILWGRKTYELVLGFTGGKGVGFGSGVKNSVFSRRAKLHYAVLGKKSGLGGFRHWSRRRSTAG